MPIFRYDPLNDTWTSCPPMTTRRRYCRVTVLDNCIYALGGFDSNNYQVLVMSNVIIVLRTTIYNDCSPRWRGWTRGWAGGRQCRA